MPSPLRCDPGGMAHVRARRATRDSIALRRLSAMSPACASVSDPTAKCCEGLGDGGDASSDRASSGAPDPATDCRAAPPSDLGTDFLIDPSDGEPGAASPHATTLCCLSVLLRLCSCRCAHVRAQVQHCSRARARRWPGRARRAQDRGQSWAPAAATSPSCTSPAPRATGAGKQCGARVSQATDVSLSLDRVGSPIPMLRRFSCGGFHSRSMPRLTARRLRRATLAFVASPSRNAAFRKALKRVAS